AGRQSRSGVSRCDEGREGELYGEGAKRCGVGRVHRQGAAESRCSQPSALCLRRSDLGDVARLRALGAVDDLEFDRLAFLERTESVTLDRGVMDEDIAASVALDKSVSLGVIEPLDLACDAHRSCS